MIEAKYFWLNVFFLMIGTIAIRASVIAMSKRVRISDRVRELFSYIPAAILPAFVAPAVFLHQGHVSWAFGKERMIILAGASVLCYFTRSTLLTIAFGLIALYFVAN